MPSGETHHMDASGNLTINKTDGRVGRKSHSGIQTWTHPDGSTIQKNTDGSILHTDSSGNTRAGAPEDWDNEGME
jgi:hypothetical protein